MRLLKINTLVPPVNVQKLGIILDTDDMISIDIVIILEHITDFSSHPEENNLTLIHLTSGRTIIANITMNDFTYIIEDMI